MKKITSILIGLSLSAAAALAGEKSVMHCFAFTPVETASQADWDAFYKATDGLPGKVPGLKRVWYGKLNRPLTQYQLKFADDAARKKAMADKKGSTDFAVQVRANGACMEFDSLKSFQGYGPHAAHKSWEEAYSKVRVEGTTTYQIIPQ